MENNGVKVRMLARASRALASSMQAGLLVAGLTLGTGVALAQEQAPVQNQAGSSDAQLQSAVQAALAGDAQLKGQQITATVSQGTVTLNGNVADDAQRIAAEQTAAQVTGVRSINDSISVGGQTATVNQPGAAPAPPADSNAQNAQSPQGALNTPPPPPPDASQQPQASPQDPQQQGNAYPQQQGRPYPQQQGGPYPQQQGGPYSQQGGYGQYPQSAPYPPAYGQQRGQFAPPPQPYAPGVAPDKQNTSGPVTLGPGLLLSVRTTQPLSTARLKDGDVVQVTAASDVYANGVIAIPRGAVLTAEVVESKNAGAFGGSPKLDLKLTSLQLGGQSYPLTSDVWSSQGPSKTGYTASNTVGGAAFGAIIGALAGGGVGAGVGAVAGGATGAAVSGATRGPQLNLPPEALLQFRLAAPLTVQPVSYNEAERLAASVPQQPVLRTRPAYAVAPYPYYVRPYYPYPAPYYVRPY